MALKLFTKKAVLVLFVINDNSVTKIHSLAYVTYSHCCKIIEKFKVMGLVNVKIIQNRRVVEMTKKGEKMKKYLCNILGGVANGYR